MGMTEEEIEAITRSEIEHYERHARYYDIAKITLTKGEPDADFWLEGKIEDAPAYRFEAKVFDDRSEYGIDGGRISKLNLYKGGGLVALYDRGWVEKPKADDHGANYALAEVKAAFSQTVEREQGAPRVEKNECPEPPTPKPARAPAPVPAPSDDPAPARAVNPMGFFRKPEPEATPARKEWRSRDTTGIRHDAPAPDLSDDHEQDR